MNYLIIAISLLITSTTAMAAQSCDGNIGQDTPTSRFKLNIQEGTAFDTKTGLTWKRCVQGQTWDAAAKTCTGFAGFYNWQEALSVAESEDFGGFTDWRLPNNKELHSIIERRCYKPTINLTVFPEALGRAFWSGTPVAAHAGNVWLVDFYLGLDDYGSTGSSFNYAVRLVRGRK